MIVTTDFPEFSYGVAEISLRYGQRVFDGITNIKAVRAEKVGFSLKNGEATVFAPTLSGAYCALGGVLSIEKEERQVCVELKKRMKNLGVMIDCARNAVPDVESLKKMIVGLALMGYTYLELYVEDCFEVNDEPYFGYMRGRYSKADLKELDTYCRMLGIELVPCIQTLAHLARIFQHWAVYTGVIQDKGDVLLVGEERTYTLIENMIKTCRECFSSNRINIGMDEAFELGKGKYFERYGYVPSHKIMQSHLSRVTEICRKYGFKPSLWADMFYDDLAKGETQGISKELTLIFWEYMCEDESYYRKKFTDLQRSGLSYSFAGGAHKWYGFTPCNAYAERVLKLQYQEAQKGGVDDFLITLWGDDGAECSYFSVLPTLLYLGEKNLDGTTGFAEGLGKKLTGYSHEELQALDLPNRLYDSANFKLCNPSKYLFYVDPFLGIEEFAAAPDYADRYKAFAAFLKVLSARSSQFAYLFKTAYRLCEYLEIKSTLTEDIDRAYKGGDKQALATICNERLPLAKKRLRAFIKEYKSQWNRENRPFGFEVEEFRLYGALGRLTSVHKKLKEYVEGKTTKIAELEEEKLSKSIDPTDEFNGCKLYNGVSVTITYGTN